MARTRVNLELHGFGASGNAHLMAQEIFENLPRKEDEDMVVTAYETTVLDRGMYGRPCVRVVCDDESRIPELVAGLKKVQFALDIEVAQPLVGFHSADE